MGHLAPCVFFSSAHSDSLSCFVLFRVLFSEWWREAVGVGEGGGGRGGVGEEGFSIMISRNRLRIPTATFEFAFLCVIVHSTRALKKPGGQFYFGANGVMLLISLFTPA